MLMSLLFHIRSWTKIISYCEVNQKAVRIGLVQDMHTGRGFDNIIVEELTIKTGASDKVIMNRYNKLLAIHNNR